MSDQTELNNWFTGELVAVSDMKPVNALIMSNVFASMPSGSVLGIVPTINVGDMQFSTTSGYAFFGVTTDTDYITNTGSTTLACTVEAQGAIELVNVNCYIYVKPNITTITGNRYTVVEGEVYSSTNASDVGIKICSVVSGVAINFNHNNIKDYFSIEDGVLTVQSPDGSTIGLVMDGTFSISRTYNGVLTLLSNTFAVDGSEWNAISREVSTLNQGRIYTYVNTTTHVGEAGLVSYVGGVEKYRLAVYGNHRPQIGLNGGSIPVAAGGDIILWEDFGNSNHLFSGNGYQKLPGGLIMQWGVATITSGTSLNVNFPIPFPNAVFSVVANGTNNAINQGIVAGVSGWNNTFAVMGISQASVSSIGISWFAIGY